MTTPKIDFATALRELAAEDRRHDSIEIEPEDIIAYHHQQLSDARMEEMRELMVRHPDAARMLLDYIALLDEHFEEPSDPTREEPSPTSVRANPSLVGHPQPSGRPSTYVPQLIAATLGGVVLGFTLLLGTSRLGERDGQINLHVASLQPLDEQQRGGSRPMTTVPAESVLALYYPEPVAEDDRFTLVMMSGDREVWRRTDLRLDGESSTFTLQLPAGLDFGRHTLLLSPSTEDRVIATYPVEITRLAAP